MSRCMYALALLLVVATVHATYVDRMLPPLARTATTPVHFFTNAATLGQWTAEATDTCTLQALSACCPTAATGYCGGAAPNTYTALAYQLPGQSPAAATTNYPVATTTMCLRPATTCTSYTRYRTIDLTATDYAYLIPYVDGGFVTSMHFDVWAEPETLTDQLEVYIKFQTAAGVDILTNTRDTKVDWTLTGAAKKWVIVQTDFVTPPVNTRKIVIGWRAYPNAAHTAAARVFVPIMGAELYAQIDDVCALAKPTSTVGCDSSETCAPLEDLTNNNNIYFDDFATSRTCTCKLGLDVDPAYSATTPVAGHLVRCIDNLAECPAAATPGTWPAHVPASHRCDTNAKCAQTLPMADGWFTCTCNAGYRQVGNGEVGHCIEINECTEFKADGTLYATCDPVAQCTNTAGSYTCACPAGFTDASGALGTGRVCRPIDECTTNADDCHAQATCLDLTPIVLTKPTAAAPTTAWTWSPRWSCNCNKGYVGNGNTICNIDVCKNCPHGDCTQVAPNYVAVVDSFYTIVNNKCTDTNECTLGTSQCNAVTSICHNTDKYFSHFTNPATYTGATWYGATCECRKGYRWDEATHQCVDILECKSDHWGPNGGCDAHATCNEVAGNVARPTCTCNWGYSGTGRTCTEIDECATGTHDCGAQTTCTNIAPKWDTTLTPAAWVGWTCACNAGYVSYNNKNCLLNECATNNGGCSMHATCTPSGMDSTAPREVACTCNAGYANLAGADGGVVNIGDACSEIDECQKGTDDCEIRANRFACVNIAPQWDAATSTWKKWLCRCPAGYYGNGKRCELLEDEECVHHPKRPNGNCDIKTADCTATGYLAFRSAGTRANPTWKFPTYAIGTANRGKARCTCKPGYKNLANLNGGSTLHEDVDGVWGGVIEWNTVCDDINECRPAGYHTYQYYNKDTDTITTKDWNFPCINYDLGAVPVDPHSHCGNTPGSYHCGCNDGWTGDAWRSYATPGVFNPLNRFAANEQYDPINHCHPHKKALIHEYAIPIVFSIMGFMFMIFVCIDGVYAAKGMVASPRPAIRWTIFTLGLLLLIFSICMLINDIWPLGVNWIFFGAFAMGAAMANNYVLLSVSGILNAIGFFQSTATIFAIRSDVNKNIVDDFNARRCEEYYHYARTWSLTEDRCDDSDYLGWLRAISVFYIIVMFIISYFSFLYTCIMRNAEIHAVYKKPQAPSSL